MESLVILAAMGIGSVFMKVVALLASSSASSLALCPTWAVIHASVSLDEREYSRFKVSAAFRTVFEVILWLSRACKPDWLSEKFLCTLVLVSPNCCTYTL